MRTATMKDSSPLVPQLSVVHYLLSQVSGEHVAHCLDLDLVEIGRSREEAVGKLDARVKSLLESALENGRLGDLPLKAAHRFWDDYLSGETVELSPQAIRIEIPDTVQILPRLGNQVGILARAHRAGK